MTDPTNLNILAITLAWDGGVPTAAVFVDEHKLLAARLANTTGLVVEVDDVQAARVWSPRAPGVPARHRVEVRDAAGAWVEAPCDHVCMDYLRPGARHVRVFHADWLGTPSAREPWAALPMLGREDRGEAVLLLT